MRVLAGLPDRMRELRTQARLTQKEVATHLGISASALGMYEQGARDPDSATIASLAMYFGVSTDYLMGLTDDPTPPNRPERKLTPADEDRIIKELLQAVRANRGGSYEDLTPEEQRDREQAVRFGFYATLEEWERRRKAAREKQGKQDT